MPIYEWRGFDGGGRKASGVVDADSPRDARVRLRRDGVLVTDVTEAASRRRARAVAAPAAAARPDAKAAAVRARLRQAVEAARGRKGGGTVTKRRLEQTGTFTRQLATLLKAGIPLTEALKAIIDQTDDRRLNVMYRDVREQIAQGTPTADALAAHPDHFDELYVAMVRSGEAAGRLDEVLERLAGFIQSQTRLRNKVQAALAYPIIMLIIGMLVVAALLVMVVPKISTLLEARGQVLPLPTRILQGTSEFLVGYWWALILALVFAVLVFNLIYSSERGRLGIDRRLLRTPVVGDLLTKQALSRFSQTFGTRTVLGNRLLEQTVDQVREKILEGADIATPIKSSGVFPPLVGYMIAVGEQSGELDSMMFQVGEAYQQEVDIATQKFTSIIEPILILCMAVIVGFIILSILWPVLQMSQSF
jgi:general secretion pathway protein F